MDYGFLNLKKHISFFPLDAAVIRVLEEVRDMPVRYPPELLKARRAEFVAQLEQILEQVAPCSSGS